MADQKEAADPKATALGCLLVVAVVVVLAIFALIGGDEDDDSTPASDRGGSPSQERDTVDEFDAQVMCEEFVKQRLKSPSSAEFSDQQARSVRDDIIWIVVGNVDSENSFGAMIRNDYQCRLKYLGDDEWRLQNFYGLDG